MGGSKVNNTRKTQTPKTTKQQTLHRIKIIKGHLNAIEKMLSNDAYCVNILHQSLAVQRALKKMDMAIMESHLKHCVVEQAKKGEDDKIVAELLNIYEFK